jgi:diguanylate cyclase (GGDEF)-like protein
VKWNSSVVQRIYWLVALILLMASIVAVLLWRYNLIQTQLYERISHYHAPAMHYTDRLERTLEDITRNISRKASPDQARLNVDFRNPLYSMQGYMASIKKLPHAVGTPLLDKAMMRLELDIGHLETQLQKLISVPSQHAVLKGLIESAQLRARQFSRLHSNASDELRNRIIDHNQHLSWLLMQITVASVLLCVVLIGPLILRIRQMVLSVQQAEQKQRELKDLALLEKSQITALLSAMSMGILFEDREGRAEYFNPAFVRMWGLREPEKLAGEPLVNFLEDSPHHFVNQEHSSKYILQVLDTHEISERFEINLSDGRVLTQLSYPVTDPVKGTLGRLWIYEDVTHERQTAQQLIYLAEHDNLTGLYNRHRFKQQLNFMIDSCNRSGAKFALLYFDLDEFKYINDSFGHSSGDSVLLRTASEISSLVRGAEMFARLGGDEFAILTALKPEDDVAALPERIVRAVSAIPFRFRGTHIRLTTSVGVAIYPEHGTDGEELVAHADTAMYQAKQQGKNTWALYDVDYKGPQQIVERMSWSRRIAEALENDLLELHYQGIYLTNNRSLSHLEVLVRMKDPLAPERLIMPGTFIPFAEKSAQIVKVDKWVLENAINMLAVNPLLPAVAVNISGRSFDEPSLPGFIRDKLIHYAVRPERLIIELTETETVADLQDAQRFIEAIHQAGCRVCLDDFGSGFSTFTYLKFLDVEILKIDGLFIQDLVNNHENQVFVKAMVSIAQGLGKQIVAEYVENEETLILLEKFGIQMVQGFYLGRPGSDLLQHINEQ